MIRLNEVRLSFGSRTILDTISLQIQQGDRIGLIGPNGTGKSTVFKLLYRLLEPDAGGLVLSKDIRLGYLPQDGFTFKKKTVFQEASSAFEDVLSLKNQIEIVHKKLENPSVQGEEHQLLLDQYAHLQHQLDVVNGAKVHAETSKVLKGMGFKESDFERNIDTFSGGWQMRVALAKLLLQDPDLLLLDEPTNHLDIDSIIWLENYLREFKGGFVIISHDRAFLDRNVTKIWELERGSISEYHGNYSFYETGKSKRTELQIARHANQEKKIKEVERFIERFRAKNTKASQVQSRILMLEKMERIELPPTATKQVKFRFLTTKQSGATVLEGKGISHTYNGHCLFKDICISIERGEKVAFVGQNGSGKSTLSRIIAGIEKPDSGTIRMGHNTFFAYFAQEHAEKLTGNNTVLQEMESDAPFAMIPYIRHILGAFLFSDDDVFKTVDVLSGGEKARLSLARMLLKPSNFMILDEPTNHIDIITKKILKDALLNYPGSLMIVSHDRDFLDGLVSKVYELKDGRIHTHLCAFRDFLEKKAASFDNGNANTRVNMPHHKAEEDSSQKQYYLLKKEQNAKKRKLTREVQEIEEHITLLETRKKEMDSVFSDAIVYTEKEKSAELHRCYKATIQELNALYRKWEAINTELESVINNN
ncbi:MAG: ABC-F family ATP-binding cassette domain-containing protein [Candidatus Loosdrechtia sp.]|uniref:ABC-F family ATP-binding cassette domain-containing protein n=1 Tax=Candidatus Loosdrechtia sp. TaxID=3101272 RepID=UPI003A63CC2A|nr:MAG: ABC-F family ATP-binding cassette domain-containing protein [Candidatus Jettenia sp. AMX2]